MKKIFILILFLLLPYTVKGLELPVDVTATGVALYDVTNDQIIYQKNIDKQVELASLTKMYTEYVAILNNPNLNKKVKITSESYKGLEAFTKIGLEEGEVLTINELLYASNLYSGADAAQALAYGTSRRVSDFITLMNQTIEDMGLVNTHLATTYGGSNDDVSTPREIVMFVNEAVKNNTFKKVFGADYLRLSNGLEAVNYTKAISNFYGYDYYLTGNKSGYTDDAGMLLASTATINGVDYILVVCNSKVMHIPNEKYHIKDSFDIYNYVKERNYERRIIISEGDYVDTINVEDATISEYIINSDSSYSLILNDEEYEKLNYDYHIIDTISSKTKKGTCLGHIDIYVGDELIYSHKIYLQDYIFSPTEELVIKSSIYVLLFAVILGLFLFNLKKKR